MDLIVKNWSLIVGAILTLGSVIGWLWRNFNKFYKLKKDNNDFHEMVIKHDLEIGQINIKVDQIIEVIATHEEQDKKVDCSILRDRIIESYKKNKEKGTGTIGALDYENLNEMFSQYFARGGNHLVTRIYEDFKTWNVAFDES